MAAAARFDLTARDRSQRAFGSFRKRLGGLVMFATRAFAPLAAAAGAVFSLQFLNKVSEAGDRMAKTALRLGTTTEYLSEMKFVTEQTGVSFELFTMSAQKMSRRIAQAAGGKGEAVVALKALGLSAKELLNLPLQQQFEIIATRLDRVRNKSVQLAIAQRVLDSEGVALLQTMKGGGEAIRLLREEARRLGAQLSGEDAKAMEDYNDAWNRLKTATGSYFRDIASSHLPKITEAVDWLTSRFVELINGEGPIVRMKELFESLGTVLISGLRGPVEWVLSKFERIAAIGRFVFGWVSEKLLPSAAGMQGRRDELTRDLMKADERAERASQLTSVATPMAARIVRDAVKTAIDRAAGVDTSRGRRVESPDVVNAVEMQNEILKQIHAALARPGANIATFQ